MDFNNGSRPADLIARVLDCGESIEMHQAERVLLIIQGLSAIASILHQHIWSFVVAPLRIAATPAGYSGVLDMGCFTSHTDTRKTVLEWKLVMEDWKHASWGAGYTVKEDSSTTNDLASFNPFTHHAHRE